MEKQLVSIVLCTYDGAIFLREQLESIIAQSWKNIELIAVDDCSSDETLNLLNEYSTKYPFIKVFSNVVNIGFNKNFEKAIKLASGNFIAIADQDDIWRQDKIELLVNFIGENWLVFSNSELISQDGKKLNRTLLPDRFSIDKWGFKSILTSNYITGHTCLFSRSLIEYILPFPDSGYYDWWIGFVALYEGKIKFLNEKLTLHRVHDDSVIQKQLVATNFNELELDKINYKATLIQLNLFKGFKDLKPNARDFLEKLIIIYQQISKKTFSRSIAYAYFNYNDFFIFDKKRNFLSKTRYSKAKKFVKTLLNTKNSII